MSILRATKITAALALIVATASTARAEEADTIFKEPPDAEVLANILYGPQYRSANDERSTAAGRFGMMINFEYDSTKIVPKSLPLLDSVGEMLGLDQVNEEVLVIVGHADSSGPEYYNQELSQRRADAVKRYLVGTFEVPERRLLTVGEGESMPHDREDPYAEINRRVVFRTVQSIVVE